MKINHTGLDGLVLIEPNVFADERGFFMESWNTAAFAEAGISAEFVQDNHSCSARGVLRGLHFQLPAAQGKLVRVVRGSVWDVAVDIRRSSPTFGRWAGFELSAENHLMLWIPAGFAHGFQALADGAELLYKCTRLYEPANEHVLAHDDPALAIDWPLPEPMLSEKDRQGTTLDRIATFP